MTEIGAEKEKAPKEGANKLGKPGATLLTFAGYAALGLVAGIFIQTSTGNYESQGGSAGVSPLLLLIAIPLIVGVIQRTTTDKPVTWYRIEARVAGIAIGVAATLLWG